MARKKSVLDEILEFGGRGIAGLTSNITRAAAPIANSFVQDYKVNVQKQQRQAQQNRQQLSNFTNNLISTGQKAGSTFLDLYKQTQKPNLIGLNLPPKTIEPFVPARIKLGIENVKTSLPLTLGAISTQIGERLNKGSILPPQYDEYYRKKYGKSPSDAFKGMRTKDIFPQLAPGLIKFGQGQIQEGMRQKAQTEAKLQQLPQPKNFTDQVIQGLQYNAPSFLVGLGASALATRFAGPKAGTIVATATFYPLNTGDIVADAKSHGATDEEASQLALATGAIISALDATGVGFILRKTPGGVGIMNNIVKRVIGSIESAVFEGGTESIQGFIQDAVAKERYDLLRNPLNPMARLLEFTLGSIMGGGAGLAIGTNISPQIDTLTGQVPEPPTNIIMPPEISTLGERVLGGATKQISPPNQANLPPAIAQFRTRPNLTQPLLDMMDKYTQETKKLVDTGQIKLDYTNVPKGARLTPDGLRFRDEASGRAVTIPVIPESPVNQDTVDSIIRGAEEMANSQRVPVGLETNLPQAITPDTGNIVGEGPVVNTTPSLPDSITVEDAQGVIGGFFTPNEMRYVNPSEDIIQTDGQRALGKYFDAIIEVGRKGGMVETKTLYHEIFHASVDNFTDPALYRAALNEVMQAEGMTQEKADNRLAEIFPDYMQGKPIKGDITRRLFEAIRNKERPFPQAQAGVQFGITSAQPANPAVASMLAEGNALVGEGKIDEGLAKLQEVTSTTLPELQGLLDKYGVSIKRLEIDTHGLYFGNPEPSYWLTVDRDSETAAMKAVAEFAKNNVQEAFTVGKRSNTSDATPGATWDFGRVLTNQEVVTIQQLANDQGIGLTLNQGTGEMRAYNIQDLDGYVPEEWSEKYGKAFENVKNAGFQFKERVDKFDAKVYNSNQYDSILTRQVDQTTQLTGRERRAVGEGAGRLSTDNIPPEVTNQTAGENPQYRVTPLSPDQERLTLNSLSQLEGKDYVSAQYIQDIVKQKGLKQAEINVLQKALGYNITPQSPINVGDFINNVKSQLLPLTRHDALEGANILFTEDNDGGGRYSTIVLPSELRGPVTNYKETIYQSPVPTTAGGVHYPGETYAMGGEQRTPVIPNYFAHVRSEDTFSPERWHNVAGVAEGQYFGAEPDIRRVIELQSDLFQKGGLDRHPALREDAPNIMTKEYMAKRQAELLRLKPYEDTWHERIIREEVKQAARDGKAKLQFPTGETALTIEGLGEKEQFAFANRSGMLEIDGPLGIKDSIGQEIYSSEVHGEGNVWIITEDLGGGRFKALPKDRLFNIAGNILERNKDLRTPFEESNEFIESIEKKTGLPRNKIGGNELKTAGYSQEDIDKFYDAIFKSRDIVQEQVEEYVARVPIKPLIKDESAAQWTEQFDISGEIDQSNPIYRFYDSEVGQYLRKNYGAQKITDPQGVTWWELNVPQGAAEILMPSFRTAPSEFTPSEKWQVVPQGQAVPPGGEFKLDLKTGESLARWPKDIAKFNARVIAEDQAAQKQIAPPSVPPQPEQPAPEGPKIFEKKPGQINVNQLELTDEQKQHVLDVARTGDYESLPNSEVKRLAEYVGIDTKNLTKQQQALQIARKFNARRRVVELEKQADALKAQSAPIEEIEAKELEIANSRDIVEAQRSFEGRSLQANKMLANEFNTPRQRIYDLLELAGVKPEVYTKLAAGIDFNNSDQVVTMYRTLVPAKFGDWIDKVRYGSMLSSLNTSIINMASNFQGAGFITPIDLTIQGILDKAANVLSGGKYKRTRFTGEGLEYAKGFYGGQYSSFMNAFKTFFSPIWDQTKEIDARFIPLTRGGIPRVVENILDAPGRSLAAQDRFALSAAQEGFRKSLAYRQKRGINTYNILETAKAKGQKVIFTSPTYQAGEGAVSDAIGFMGNKLQSLVSEKTPAFARWPAKFTVPFIRIGTNLSKTGAEYFPPTGILNLAGNTNKIEQLSHVVLGSAVAYGAFKLAAAGLLVGGYDKDKTKRDQQRDAGILDWSIKVPGLDGKTIYMQFSKMHPLLGFNLGLMAAVFQAVEQGELNEDKADVLMDAVAKVLQYTNDQTYWRNVGGFVDIMNGDPYAVEALFSNYPSQIIPFRALGGWITRIIDKYQRAPDPDADIITKIVQKIQGGTPLLSTGVPTRKSPYGEELEHPNRLFNLISPYRTSIEDPTGLRLYEQMKERAYSNKLLDKMSEESAKLKDSLIKLSPEELRTKKGQDLQKEIDKNALKLGVTPSSGGGDKPLMFINPNDPTEVITIDLNKFSKTKGGIAGYKQTEEKYSAARQIHDAPISDEEKNNAYKKLGTNAEEVRYDYISNQTEEVKTNYLIDKFTDQPKDFIIERLVTGRLNSSSGKVFASNGVIDNLVDEGIITKDEGKALKAIKYNKGGQLILSGAGKKVNLSLISVKHPLPERTAFKFSGPSASFANVSLALRKLKLIPPSVISAGERAKFTPTNFQLKLRTPVKTLVGLGTI